MVKTILELQDEKGNLTKANQEIFDLADAEQRSMTQEESNTVAQNLATLDKLDMEIRNATFKANTKGTPIASLTITKPKEKFSLIKAVNDIVEQRSLSEIARDISTIGKQQLTAAGCSPQGNLVIPYEVRADILAGTPTAGQEIVAEDKMKILPPLVDKLLFGQLGCTFLPGLKGTVSIPSYAGTAVAWKTEVAAAVDGGGAFAEVTMSPLRVTGFIDVSKTFLAQDSVGAEQLLMDNIVNAVARHIEKTVFGIAIGVAGTQPGSFGYTLDVANANTEAGIVPSWASILTMESNVAAANALEGKLAYVTNPAGRKILKTIEIPTNTGVHLCEDNIVNGYPLFASNSVSTAAGTAGTDELLIFGDWSQLLIGQWGGYDVLVDPYSLATTNQVRIVVNAYVDVKSKRGTSGAGADIIEFPTCWDVDAIKAS